MVVSRNRVIQASVRAASPQPSGLCAAAVVHMCTARAEACVVLIQRIEVPAAAKRGSRYIIRHGTQQAEVGEMNRLGHGAVSGGHGAAPTTGTTATATSIRTPRMVHAEACHGTQRGDSRKHSLTLHAPLLIRAERRSHAQAPVKAGPAAGKHHVAASKPDIARDDQAIGTAIAAGPHRASRARWQPAVCRHIAREPRVNGTAVAHTHVQAPRGSARSVHAVPPGRARLQRVQRHCAVRNAGGVTATAVIAPDRAVLGRDCRLKLAHRVRARARTCAEVLAQ
eukprot:363171-Chlamydomonas_euryale.AAC.5